MRTFLFVILFMASEIMFAQSSYFNYTGATFKLGRGFSKNDFKKLYSREALNYDTVINSKNSLSSELHTYIFRDQQSMNEKLNIDAKIDARYLMYSGSSSFHLDNSSAFDANSLTIGIVGRTIFDNITLKNVSVAPEAKRLLDASDFTSFKKLYGENYIGQMNPACYLYLILTIQNVSQESQNKLGVTMGIGGSIGVVSANVKTSLTKEISNASSSGRVSFQVMSSGGSGIAALSNLIKTILNTNPDINLLQNALGDYIKDNFKYENAVPYQFTESSYNQYGLIYDEIWDNFRESIIQDVANEYNKLFKQKQILEKVTEPDNYKLYLLTDDQKKTIDSVLPFIKKRLSELATNHRKILSGDSLSGIVFGTTLDFDILKVIPKFPEYKILFSNENTISNVPLPNGFPLGMSSQPVHYVTPLDFVITTDLNNPNNFKFIDNLQLISNNETVLDFAHEYSTLANPLQFKYTRRLSNLYVLDPSRLSFATPISGSPLQWLIQKYVDSKIPNFLASKDLVLKIPFNLIITDKVGNTFDFNLCNYIISREYSKPTATFFSNCLYTTSNVFTQQFRFSPDQSLIMMKDSIYYFIKLNMKDKTLDKKNFELQFENKKIKGFTADQIASWTISIPTDMNIKSMDVYWVKKYEDFKFDYTNFDVLNFYKKVTLSISKLPFSDPADIIISEN